MKTSQYSTVKHSTGSEQYIFQKLIRSTTQTILTKDLFKKQTKQKKNKKQTNRKVHLKDVLKIDLSFIPQRKHQDNLNSIDCYLSCL